MLVKDNTWKILLVILFWQELFLCPPSTSPVSTWDGLSPLGSGGASLPLFHIPAETVGLTCNHSQWEHEGHGQQAGAVLNSKVSL